MGHFINAGHIFIDMLACTVRLSLYLEMRGNSVTRSLLLAFFCTFLGVELLRDNNKTSIYFNLVHEKKRAI